MSPFPVKNWLNAPAGYRPGVDPVPAGTQTPISAEALEDLEGRLSVYTDDVAGEQLDAALLGVAGGVAALGGDGKVPAGQLPPLVESGSRSFESFGAIGDGVADDSDALQEAFAASVAEKVRVVGKPGAIYQITQQGTKAFRNPVGTQLTKGYGVEIPDGASVDGNGAKLRCAADANFVVLCNDNMDTGGDTIDCRGFVVDGGGQAGTTRDVPMVWFYGLKGGAVRDIDVTNCHFVAGLITNSEGVDVDNLTAHDVTGQGWSVGGNVADQCREMTIGTIRAWNIQTYGGFSQPGNGVAIGCDSRTTVKLVWQRNCAAGIKFLPNDASRVAASYCSGLVKAGETDFGSSNSGVKIQGETGNYNSTQIGTAISEDNFGMGLVAWWVREGGVSQYVGLRNGRGGLDADITIKDARMTFGTVVSRDAGYLGIYFAPQETPGRVTYGSIDIENPCGVAPTSRYGMSMTTAWQLVGGPIRIVDTRGGGALMERGFAIGTADAIVSASSVEAWGHTAFGVHNPSGSKVSIGASKTAQGDRFGNTIVQVFTATATYTQPAGATSVKAMCQAGGGGGGSGRRTASATAVSGGAGGGGGGYVERTFSAAELAATVTVTVGTGGTGGAAATADSTNGAAGGAGSQAAFGFLRAQPGGGGGGGSTASSTAGASGAGQVAGGASGGIAVGVAGPNAGGSSFAGAPGGGGGGLAATPAVLAGGTGGNSLQNNFVAGGTGGTTDGQAGAAGADSYNLNLTVPGSGGGGGASSIIGAGGSGGAGGKYGAGGGGGCSLNGFASGAGGAGGPGLVVVITTLG